MVGYNNNIPHKGRMYHVQTEDSGAKRPHIITHLFADGGTIINTKKTSYSDLLGETDVNEKVRQLMKKQHKAMVVSLRDGEYDEVIVSLLGSVTPGELGDAPPPVEELAMSSEPVDSATADSGPVDEDRAPSSVVPGSRGSKPPSEETSYRFIGGRSERAGDSGVAARRRRRRKSGAHSQHVPDDQKSTRAMSRPSLSRSQRFGEALVTDRPLAQAVLEFLSSRS
jgi:hypothetical protein